MSTKTNRNSQQKLSTFEKIEKMHPYKMMVLLSMIGSSLIFLFMLVAYTVSAMNRPFDDPVSLPKAFFFSTLLLLVGHFFVQPINQLFYSGQLRKMRLKLMLSTFLGLGFLVSQLYAWKAMKVSGMVFTGIPADSFLYVISGLHALHLLAAILFSFVLYSQVARIENDPIRYLIEETNPFWRVKLDILHILWIFLDALWVLLFLSFLFTS
jgi:cytochrome c oxidase subunit III